MLSNGFAESKGRASIDAPFPEDQAPFTDEYDYESDSDLEDDEVAVQKEDVSLSPSRRGQRQWRHFLGFVDNNILLQRENSVMLLDMALPVRSMILTVDSANKSS